MAFLRSICAPRTTNLVYSRSGNTGSSSSNSKRIRAVSANSVWGANFGSSRNASSTSNGTICKQELLNVLLKRQLQQQQLQRQLLRNALYSASSSPSYTQRHYLHESAAQRNVVQPAAAEKVAAGYADKASNQKHTQQKQMPMQPTNPQRDPLDVSFNNPIAAFKSKTTWELIRAYIVYTICSSSYLVEHNMQVRATYSKLFLST